MAGLRTTQILGIVLLVVGIAVLVYGITTWNALQDELGYRLGKALQQKSERADQAIIAMVAGGVVTLAGLVSLLIPVKRSGKRRRR